MIATGTPCSFCGHTYIFPCNGERYDCANAVWVRQHGRADKEKPVEGKGVTKPKRNRAKEQVVHAKPKRKRVRL